MPLTVESLRRRLLGVAENRPKRLFNKNTGLCERESGRIGADSARCWKVKGEVSASEALN